MWAWPQDCGCGHRAVGVAAVMWTGLQGRGTWARLQGSGRGYRAVGEAAGQRAWLQSRGYGQFRA